MAEEPRPPIEGRVTQLQGSSTLSATASVISLPKVEEHERLTVTERIALSDQGLRKQMVSLVIGALLFGDLITFGALYWWTTLDQENLGHKLIAPGDRIIDHQVVLALLGATTVQVGVIAGIIARYLFPNRTPDK